MKLLLLIITVLTFQTLIGQTSNTMFDFEAFTLTADSSWKRVMLRGIDSYVGGISIGRDNIKFDYGLKKELGGLSIVTLLRRGFQSDIANRLALVRGKVTIIAIHKQSLNRTTYFFWFMLPFRKYTLFFSSNHNTREVRRIIASCRLRRLKIRE